MSLIPGIGKKSVIGIDLGSSEIKALELNVTQKGIKIASLVRSSMQKGILEMPFEERREIYVDSLKEILSYGKFSTKKAALSISGNSVIVRLVNFPVMEPEELQQTIQYEAEPHIPFDIDDVIIDTHIIGDIKEGGEKKMQTVLVASKKETVGEKMEIVKACGLKPVVIDVDIFAVGNMYEMLNPASAEELIIFVNIGESKTNISIVESGTAKVVRDLYTAGGDFTEAIRDSYQVSTKKAEIVKRKYGLSGWKRKEEENIDDGDHELLVYKVLNPVVQELISEVQRSIDFFRGQQSGKSVNVDKVVLSGGSAKLKFFSEMMSKELNIPVDVFSPLSGALNAPPDMDAGSPALAVAGGLAIREAGGN